MPNKIKFRKSSDNLISTSLSSVGTDGSGQGNIGTREIISANHVRITDTNSNTRQTHLIQGLTGGQEYTVSIEYLKVSGAPTFRFQLQGYLGAAYKRTIIFTNTEETGLIDIDGWQTASWTFTLHPDDNAVRIWWQDGADYAQYTHTFELRNPDLRLAENNSVFSKNVRIGVNGYGDGPSSLTRVFKGASVPEGGYVIYSPESAFITTNEDDFLGRIAELRGAYPNGVNDALNWVNEQEDILVLDNVVNNIATDGLVLNLDAGALPSFVDNKPTVNLVSNWNLDTGWSKGYQNNIVFNEIAPPEGVDAPTVGFNRATSSAYWYSYGNYTSQVPGETYTVSIYVKTQDPNFRINFYTADNSETGRYWSGHIAVPNDGKWHRVVWPAFTNASNSQSDSLSFNMQMSGQYGESAENRTWLCAPQFQQGTQVTPWVAGTRAQNSTWYDLSGHDNTHSIVANPEFDSSIGTFNLNETQGFRLANMPTNSKTSTVAIWYKTTDTQELWVKGNTGSYYIGASYGNNYYHQNSGSPSYYIDTISSVNPTSARNGRYHMFEAKNVDFSTWTQMNWFLYGSSWNMNGTVAKIMVYDKTLTAEESNQNYYGAPIVTDGLNFALDAGNLVSYEKGSTTTYNLAGSDTGTLVNAVGFNKGNGGSWIFDGNDDYIQTNLTGTYSQITFEFTGFFDDPTLNTKTRNESAFGDWISSRIHFGTRWSVGMHWNVNGSWNEIPNTNLKYGWNHYVLVWDNVNNKKLVYINGILSDSRTTNGNITLGDFKIGVATNLNAYYRGNISTFKTYTKALTESEVLQNFNAQRTRFGI